MAHVAQGAEELQAGPQVANIMHQRLTADQSANRSDCFCCVQLPESPARVWLLVAVRADVVYSTVYLGNKTTRVLAL